MTKLKIGLIGDYNQAHTAHVCIPEALKISAGNLSLDFETVWLPTDDINLLSLPEKESFAAFWGTPGSPYKNRVATLSLIHFARVNKTPYLGTCGGYQHAIVEFAINELGLKSASIEEEEPDASLPIISALSCRLTDETRPIEIIKNSKLATIMQSSQISEQYRCGFGMNPSYSYLFEKSALQFCAYNDERVPQGFELSTHDFFIGTAFQPERSAKQGTDHPLISAFLKAAARG